MAQNEVFQEIPLNNLQNAPNIQNDDNNNPIAPNNENENDAQPQNLAANNTSYFKSVKAIFSPPGGTREELIILVSFFTLATIVLVIAGALLPWFGYPGEYQYCCSHIGHTSWVYLFPPLANVTILPLLVLLFSCKVTRGVACSVSNSVATTVMYTTFLIVFLTCFTIFISDDSHRGSWQHGAIVIAVSYLFSLSCEVLQIGAFILAITHYNVQQRVPAVVVPPPLPTSISITIKDSTSPMHSPDPFHKEVMQAA